MNRFSIVTALLTLLLVFASSMIAHAHPAKNYVATKLPACYGGDAYSVYGPEDNFRTITFVEHYPDPSELSNIEHYMMRGTIDGPPELCQDGNGLMPWYREIMYTAKIYYKRFGKFPAAMTVEDYAAAHGISPSEVNMDEFAVLHNPITDELAKLTSVEFSPGDMYLKALDQEEMEHYASIDEMFRELWKNNRVKKGDGTWRPVKMYGPAVYVRVYGAEGVIHNAVEFTFMLDND